MSSSTPPLIAHIVYRFDVGGLENGVVNLINRIPAESYRHVIISLTDASDFKHRIKNREVDIYCLHKKPGQDPKCFWNLWKLLRKLKPAITHTRNLAALETVPIALLAGVRRRVHSEHGWDVTDLDGSNRKYQMLRLLMSKILHRYISLSKQIQTYLNNQAGIPLNKITLLYNGVDAERFNQNSLISTDLLPAGFVDEQSVVIGTVGRMESVKDQVTLAEAFIKLHALCVEQQKNLRLVMIGDGSLRSIVHDKLSKAGIIEQAWLPGSHDQVPALMQEMDIFVLPSLNEGISNTILEAMASSLPVVATQVGGNPELVVAGETGQLVPAQDAEAMAVTIQPYITNPSLCLEHGQAGRARIEQNFMLQQMVENYTKVYDSLFS